MTRRQEYEQQLREGRSIFNAIMDAPTWTKDEERKVMDYFVYIAQSHRRAIEVEELLHKQRNQLAELIKRRLGIEMQDELARILGDVLCEK